ncbi:transglutaminase domain-containing protein [Eggerthella sinensis]|uniref:transglutaminase domain-containing protein n=1 Tax=Eggerthella sinensis TaxID=242230 RepID=UPI001D096682|nr:transglutaminase-like domain-containing protein [Eggerthella sinensis]MCB7038379.1 transglutaminase-like domain-containing protein [Eggerthella sinensis]
MRTIGTIAAGRGRRAKADAPPFSCVRLSRSAARATCAALLAATLALSGCGATTPDGPGSTGSTGEGQTSGAAFERPELALSPFDETAATGNNGVLFDTSHLSEGYVAVLATSSVRLKFQVSSNGVDYYYDLPSDGTPISCPLTAGSGSYTFTAWENTTGQRYAELDSITDVEVSLADEFQPFIRPSIYCDYDASSKSTKLANDLTADAQNEGDVLRSIYDWIVDDIAYNEGKAAQLADATGYLPSPDATIDEGSGICFDYASLAAAMLRSQGIPCKIITGYVSPDDIYHAWNMVYIDGTWVDARIDVKQNTWTRIDTTFAAGSGSAYVGDGTTYTEQFTY